MIVFELQFAAVQPGDSGCKAQAQAGAGRRAALLKTHETLDHAAAIGFRNAGTAIGHGEHNAITLTVRLDHNLGRHAVRSADDVAAHQAACEAGGH